MSYTSERGRFWEGPRRLSARTPLRVKLITALLALVAIALTVISLTSLAVFRGYLQDRADSQLHELIGQAGHEPRVGRGQGPSFALPGYVVELRDSDGHLVPGFGTWQQLSVSGPGVPANKPWLSANAGKLVTVPALSGNDNWRVITQELQFHITNIITGENGPTQTGTLIVGVDLGNIDQTIAWLGKIDLLVSLVVVIGLAIVGITIVRASLRPLTDIERTAQAIAAGDLSQRVPDSDDPRTEIGRLGRSLNAMLAQIEASFRAREESEAAARWSEERMRQFVADASHELRTPLTAMRGYAEYYRQRGGLGPETEAGQAAGRPPAGAAIPAAEAAVSGPATPGEAGPAAAAGQQAAAAGQQAAAAGQQAAASSNGNGALTKADLDRIMQRVEQESARMGVLVEDMLLLARLDQQRPIERRPVDLLTLAADAVQDARMIAPRRTIELTVVPGTAFLVLGDEVRLRQVIGNLMSNALTHTPEGTPVEVRILPGALASAPGVVLEVTDQGPGLHPDQAERVFERFYRADQARTRRTGGTGLGLAIVAALVAAHGGTVSVDSVPGRGATFRIVLPLAPEAQDHPGWDTP